MGVPTLVDIPPSPGPKMREGPVSDHSFTAEMHALPAISARWAAIGRQNRRAGGRGKDNAAARNA